MDIRIEGMTCGHCAKAVASALAAVPGVTRVAEVDVTKGAARVEGAPSADAVEAAVEAAGYRATIVAG
jgi:copper chaperone